MEITVQGHGMMISSKLSAHVKERAARLDRYLPGAEELRVEFKRSNASETAPRVVQLTARRKRAILRVEEHHTDPYTAFDTALDKLYQRIARFKGRRADRKRSGLPVDEELANAEAPPTDVDSDGYDDNEKLVRVKTFTVVPMSVEEAVEQMILVGHSFYVFMHDNDDTIKVVYARKDGNYGLLQPEK